MNCQSQTNNTNQVENLSNTLVVNDDLQVNHKHIFQDLEEFKLESNSNMSYKSIKESIEVIRLELAAQNIALDSISRAFKKSLLHQIIPYWEGTEWSFEGHTSTPKERTIACGYFVSTTLRDIGLRVNRYKLAQQSPINEAKSLAVNSPVIKIEAGSNAQNIKSIHDTIPEGIHFIGFDQSHVGYLLKEETQLYLIHSNYIDARGVEIEAIEKSDVFSSYNRFYIVELSTNENLLNNWIKGTPIEVIMR